jgi:hypothetical protein
LQMSRKLMGTSNNVETRSVPLSGRKECDDGGCPGMKNKGWQRERAILFHVIVEDT